MSQSWNLTQSRLKKWQKTNPTAWELRRILSDSEFFRFIAFSAFQKAPNKTIDLSWEEWWGMHLEKLDERKAIDLLLDVWNKDVWTYLQLQVRAESLELLNEIEKKVFAQPAPLPLLENHSISSSQKGNNLKNNKVAPTATNTDTPPPDLLV